MSSTYDVNCIVSWCFEPSQTQDVLYQGSTINNCCRCCRMPFITSLSTQRGNIESSTKRPQTQRMLLKSYVLNKESTKPRCRLESVHKLRGPSTKSPSALLVTLTSHVFWRVNRANGQRGILVSSTCGRSSTIILNVIKMMSPAKGPQTQ